LPELTCVVAGNWLVIVLERSCCLKNRSGAALAVPAGPRRRRCGPAVSVRNGRL